MIYVSFVTKNTPYEEVVKNYLIPSLKRWNLSYDIDYIEDRGSWTNNIYYKPEFLYNMLIKHKESIVSLDADATIEQFPELFGRFSPDIDVGAHHLDWKAWYGKGDKKELLGGTLYFNYNEKVLKLINDWKVIQKNTGRFPQKVLENILKERSDINIYELPLSYCYIKSRPNNKQPLVLLNPVILHHQMSRKYKNR